MFSKSQEFFIEEGDPGVEKTLRSMRRLVLASTRDPEVIEWAQDVVRGLPERDPDASARAFLDWVRANCRYTEDPVDVELVKSPQRMLIEHRLRGSVASDCDDQVTLLSAGLNAVGIPTEFLVIAADSSAPDSYSHVLMQYLGRDGWITIDPIVRGTGLGWFPPRYTRIGSYGGSGSTNLRGSSGGGLLLLALAAGWICLSRRAS